eukprot:4230984-Ditylum_brightwellii.AAC.2
MTTASKSYKEKNVHGRVGAESFRKITKAITTMDQHTKHSVDYVSRVPINDNFMIIHSVLDTSEDVINMHNMGRAGESCLKTIMEKQDFNVTDPSFAFLLDQWKRNLAMCVVYHNKHLNVLNVLFMKTTMLYSGLQSKTIFALESPNLSEEPASMNQ